ncbi:MAG: ABC transporter permease [Planctomycetales bacterium]|nr:ABC transporter permease [Planctomycetales bacterium]
MMNPAIQRLLWKDYREYRGLWCAMLIGSAFFLMLLVGIELANRSKNLLGSMPIEEPMVFIWFGVAICFPAAIGATSFSREHEQGTYVFLRTFPVRARSILLCRTALVAASAVMLSVLLCLFAATISKLSSRLSFSLDGEILTTTLPISFLIAAEAYVVGVFFSFLSKHPLFALLLTGLVLMVLHGTVLMSISIRHHDMVGQTAVNAGLATIVFALLDLTIAPKWFSESVSAPVQISFARPRVERPILASRVQPNLLRMVVSLLWQQWRQLWIWYAATILFCLYGIATLSDSISSTVGAIIIANSPFLFSASVFYPEKIRDNYKFMAQRGVSTAVVWWTRNSLWLAVFAAVALIGQLFFPSQAKAFTWILLVVFAATQVCILVTEQYIVGIFVAIIVSVGLAAWAGFSGAIGIPAWIAILPVTLTCLFASYRRLRDLLSERNGIKNKAFIWSIVSFGVAATIVCTASYRVFSIQSTDGREAELLEVHELNNSLSAEQNEVFKTFLSDATELIIEPVIDGIGRFHFVELESLRTADTEIEWVDRNGDGTADTPVGRFDERPVHNGWTHQWSNIRSIAKEETDWLAENEKAMEAVCKSLDDPTFAYGASDLGSLRHGQINRRAVRLLVASARAKTVDGELESAVVDFKRALKLTDAIRKNSLMAQWVDAVNLEELVLDNIAWWAGANGLSRESLRNFAEWLAEHFEQPPSPELALANDYANVRATIESDEWLSMLSESRASDTFLIYRFMPWERIRTRRFVDLMHVKQYDWLTNGSSQLKEKWYTERTPQPIAELSDELNNTVAAHWFVHNEIQFGRSAVKLENHRRALIWQLRLMNYAIQYGSYPTHISELVSPSRLNAASTNISSFEADIANYEDDVASEGVNLPGGLVEPDNSSDQPTDQDSEFVNFRHTDLTANAALFFRYEPSSSTPITINEPLGSYKIVTTDPVIVSGSLRFPLPQLPTDFERVDFPVVEP